MFQPMNFGNAVNKTDFMLYSVSVALGLAIIFANYYMSVAESQQTGGLGSYLERIITRMDTVSGQLSAWGAIDVRKELNSF